MGDPAGVGPDGEGDAFHAGSERDVCVAFVGLNLLHALCCSDGFSDCTGGMDFTGKIGWLCCTAVPSWVCHSSPGTVTSAPSVVT